MTSSVHLQLGVIHPERTKQPISSKFLQWLAGGRFEDGRE
jgi:hypothetical protein